MLSGERDVRRKITIHGIHGGNDLIGQPVDDDAYPDVPVRDRKPVPARKPAVLMIADERVDLRLRKRMEIAREKRRGRRRTDCIRCVQRDGIVVFVFVDKALVRSALLADLRFFVRFLFADGTFPVVVPKLRGRDLSGVDLGHPELSGKILAEIGGDIASARAERFLNPGADIFRRFLHVARAYRIDVNGECI